ncbi:MAG: hypothetical protein UY35_C0003G0017 [Candidatus Saccharibacteria bacterium GW2011_GWC2_48_9]|nr:MAG: hypothetical protein UY35_C0003G0017 [Candidatus Saccharibacteria bacterium GW2011_GWC2_48_9]HCH34154.1 hypothetical protein [Candidatus Saccharibacteria bacterium]
MFQGFIYRILVRRHFWRNATFGEIAELYTARMLRMTANAMIATFVAIYMFKNDYSLHFIAGYYVIYFLFKALMAYPGAQIVARVGPKHAMLIANVVSIPSLIAFSFLDEIGIWALLTYTLCQGSSMTLYSIAHLVDFSKVKHDDNAGKEIGYMNIIDKIAAGISPLVGGLIAWLINPEVTMWVASVLLLLAAVPLFRTAEPVRLGQKLDFRGFPWAMAWRSMRAEVAVGIDSTAVMVIWPLFLASVVFMQSGDVVYAQIGALSAIAVFVGLIVSHVYGVLIDRKRGRELLISTTALKSLTHLMRPFVVTPVSAVMTNVLNEVAAAGYAMAFMRGMFDLADRTGHRIVYVLCIEAALNVGGVVASLVLFLALTITTDAQIALGATFIFAGIAILFIMSARFPIYRHSR